MCIMEILSWKCSTNITSFFYNVKYYFLVFQSIQFFILHGSTMATISFCLNYLVAQLNKLYQKKPLDVGKNSRQQAFFTIVFRSVRHG